MTAPQSVFLCGFMGSGKSSLGEKTASILGLEYYDLDEFIEKREQKNISAIFEEEGENGFRTKETHYLNELLHLAPLCLIALGGGTVCFNNNLELLKSKGLLVYLDVPADTLSNRLFHSKNKRPLLEGKNRNETLDFVEKLLDQRKSYYESAQLKVKSVNLSAEQLANEIRKLG